MLARLQKRSQDGVALRRMFQADTFQMLVQNSLGFAHHLPRDAFLIVNAFLEHVTPSLRGSENK
jgi:hypothetical protein